MRLIRLIVNWGIVILSPLWILPFLLFFIWTEQVKCKEYVYYTGEKWLWE